MASLWKKFEKEYGREFSKIERDLILGRAVRDFIQKDLRFYEVDGVTYVKSPEKFREALLRRIIEGEYNASTSEDSE